MEELIITSVFKREPLWNPFHPLYRNVGEKKKLWREAANEVNTDEKNVKIKWKHMRAYFFKELRKIEKRKIVDGADGARPSQWMYFEPLSFLRSIISTSEQDSNSSIADQSLLYPESLDEQPIPCTSSYNIQDSLMSDGRSTPSPTSSSSHTSTKIKIDEPYSLNEEMKIMELKQRQFEIFDKDGNCQPNSDLLFFKSIIPYMVDIPMIRKLRLRSKIQDFILNELQDNTDVQSITDVKSTHDNSL